MFADPKTALVYVLAKERSTLKKREIDIQVYEPCYAAKQLELIKKRIIDIDIEIARYLK